MSEPVVDLDTLRAAVTKQGALVRQLKADGAPGASVQAAVEELQGLRKKLDALEVSDDSNKWKVNKKALEDTLIRRMFVVPSFEIHGGVAGLFDYGPPGCALKENLLSLWRQHFVLEDGMLQIECTTLTPYPVLKTSGHVDRFEDLMVKDTKNGECFRADKLLEDFIENLCATDKAMPSSRRDELRKIAAQADAYEPGQLDVIFKDLGIVSPSSGAPLTPAFPFNLMFQTSIGPTGQVSGFLRPETAQGMFVNFRRLIEYNCGRMPMAVAQIGSAYRNEIAPRGGLIRVREFTMAEIEHFVHPDKKAHPKFHTVAPVLLNLFPADAQVGDGRTIAMTIGEAVAKGMVNNETLGYFMARTAQFFTKLGIKSEGLRFRQHLKTEMAHYACDCWDAEILMNQGWVECVGHADRSAYDLKVHSKVTKTELVAREVYPEPRDEDVVVLKTNKGLMGKTFKLDNAAVVAALDELVASGDVARAGELGAAQAATGSVSLAIEGGKSVELTPDMCTFHVERKRVSERKYIPNVIEPSFGIGRIITGLLEHSFYTRGGGADEQKAVLAFAPAIAPYKVILLPLDGRIDGAHLAALASALNAAGLSSMLDDSGASVGKRYARADEVGTPFAVTFDHKSLVDGAVTLRERDSTGQVRLPLGAVVDTVEGLIKGKTTWATVAGKYGLLKGGGEEEGGGGAAPAAVGAPVAGGAAAPALVITAGGATLAEGGVQLTGTLGVQVRMEGKNYGRFARPADLQ